MRSTRRSTVTSARLGLSRLGLGTGNNGALGL